MRVRADCPSLLHLDSNPLGCSISLSHTQLTSGMSHGGKGASAAAAPAGPPVPSGEITMAPSFDAHASGAYKLLEVDEKLLAYITAGGW